MATQHVRTGLLNSLCFLEMKFSNREIFSRGLTHSRSVYYSVTVVHCTVVSFCR